MISPSSCVTLIFRYVDKIEIYFLPVGHTHGQIDQMFSCLSRYLKFKPAKTLPELCHSLHIAYNNPTKSKAKKQKKQEGGEEKKAPDKEVITQIINTVVDIKTKVEAMEIKGARKKMTLKDSQAFMLERHRNGNDVIVRSKQWASSGNWLVDTLFIINLICRHFHCKIIEFFFVYLARRWSPLWTRTQWDATSSFQYVPACPLDVENIRESIATLAERLDAQPHRLAPGNCISRYLSLRLR